MKPHIRNFLVGLLALQCCVAGADETDIVSFEGEGNRRTAVFETTGPWLLDWSTKRSLQLAPVFEMRLHDGNSGDYLGTLVELQGTGGGRKLFEDPGQYQIAIVASNVSWRLDISEVSVDEAARIKRRATGVPSLQDSALQSLRRVREGTFSSWRPDGNDTLLLFDSDGLRWRATFSRDCPGLDSAKAISFVTPAAGSMEEYDSILLEDGTRCYFERVVPTVLN